MKVHVQMCLIAISSPFEGIRFDHMHLIFLIEKLEAH